MENLHILASEFTPAVLLDSDNSLVEIKGESYPENIDEFYSPIMDWIKKYLDESEEQLLVVNMRMTYFNSSSSKVLLDLFDLCDEAKQEGKNVSVNWFHDAEDSLSKEYGEEFQEEYEYLPFRVIEFED